MDDVFQQGGRVRWPKKATDDNGEDEDELHSDWGRPGPCHVVAFG